MRLVWDPSRDEFSLGLDSEAMAGLAVVLRDAARNPLPRGIRRPVLDFLTCLDLTIERAVGAPGPLPPSVRYGTLPDDKET